MSSEKLPPMITTAPGLYRHYKGNMYEVIGTARHSETLEPMTLYKKWGHKKWGQIPISNDAQQGESLWVRPAAMFEEVVLVDGISQPRFAKVHDEK